MNTKLFQLGQSDFIKGLSITVIVAVLTSLLQIVNAPGFSFESFDYNLIVKMAVVSGVSYIIKNFASDENGRLLGKI